MVVKNTCVLIASAVALTMFTVFKLLVFLTSPLQKEGWNSKHEVKELQENLTRIYSQIKLLTKCHSRLILRLKITPGVINDSTLSTLQHYSLGFHPDEHGPSEEYEIFRRRTYFNTKELWYYLSHQLRNTINQSTKLFEPQTIIEEVAQRKRWLLSIQENLPHVDGHEEWRREEAASASELVQRRLHYLQNPSDCHSARKLICSQDFGGFGCNTHHLVYCLVIAYASERTLLVSHIDDVSANKYWTKIIQPMSETCTQDYGRHVYLISDKYNHTALFLHYMRYFGEPGRPYLLPKDLAQRITRFSSDSYAWWIGQFVKYVLKLQKPDMINAEINKMNFTSPIVGVHIRRTDKKDEAEYHSLDEYMHHVADYYEQLELTHSVDQRRVFLATDDVNVFEEAISKYPQYKFYGNRSRAKAAAVGLRYTAQGYEGILVDLHALAMCDYVICTFSSNVGRLAYELMHTKYPDAASRFISLDDMYYFTDNEYRMRKAVMRHKDITLEVGDMIKYQCKNSTSVGTVLRTHDRGRIPWHKTEEHFMEHPYPEYKQVLLTL